MCITKPKTFNIPEIYFHPSSGSSIDSHSIDCRPDTTMYISWTCGRRRRKSQSGWQTGCVPRRRSVVALVVVIVVVVVFVVVVVVEHTGARQSFSAHRLLIDYLLFISWHSRRFVESSATFVRWVSRWKISLSLSLSLCVCVSDGRAKKHTRRPHRGWPLSVAIARPIFSHVLGQAHAHAAVSFQDFRRLPVPRVVLSPPRRDENGPLLRFNASSPTSWTRASVSCVLTGEGKRLTTVILHSLFDCSSLKRFYFWMTNPDNVGSMLIMTTS